MDATSNNDKKQEIEGDVRTQPTHSAFLRQSTLHHDIPPTNRTFGSGAGLISVQTLGISFVIAALVLLVITLLARRKSKAKGNSILFVGSSDSGKTAILSALAYKQILPTHASLQTNSITVSFSQGKKTMRLIDIPGHPRVRHQYREHFPDAKAIVFVVDSSTISRNGAAVAEHLHQMLHTFMAVPPSQASPAFLILAHKSDLLSVTSSSGPPDQLAINRVRTVLERELEKRRQAQAGGMGVESLGGEDDGSELGGLECSGSSGGTFKFSDWEGGEVDFLGTSVVMKTDEEKDSGCENGLITFQQWLENLA